MKGSFHRFAIPLDWELAVSGDNFVSPRVCNNELRVWKKYSLQIRYFQGNRYCFCHFYSHIYLNECDEWQKYGMVMNTNYHTIT